MVESILLLLTQAVTLAECSHTHRSQAMTHTATEQCMNDIYLFV